MNEMTTQYQCKLTSQSVCTCTNVHFVPFPRHTTPTHPNLPIPPPCSPTPCSLFTSSIPSLLLLPRRDPLLAQLLNDNPDLRLDKLISKVHGGHELLGHGRGEGLPLDPAGLDPLLQLGPLVGVAVRGVDGVRQQADPNGTVEVQGGSVEEGLESLLNILFFVFVFMFVRREKGG